MRLRQEESQASRMAKPFSSCNRDHLDYIDEAKSSSRATLSSFFRKKNRQRILRYESNRIVEDILPFKYMKKKCSHVHQT